MKTGISCHSKISDVAESSESWEHCYRGSFYEDFRSEPVLTFLGQVWYLIVSIPDLCNLTYFHKIITAGEFNISMAGP